MEEKVITNKSTSNPSPCNLKSLCAYLFGILNGLRDGDINPNQGVAIAKVASQINQAYSNNLKKTMIEITLEKMGKSVDAKLQCLDSKMSSDEL